MGNNLKSACDGVLQSVVTGKDRVPGVVAMITDRSANIYEGIAGERRLREWELPWLPGYEGSRPVRVGNGAHCQLQLDVYGDLFETAWLYGRGDYRIDRDTGVALAEMADLVCDAERCAVARSEGVGFVVAAAFSDRADGVNDEFRRQIEAGCDDRSRKRGKRALVASMAA